MKYKYWFLLLAASLLLPLVGCSPRTQEQDSIKIGCVLSLSGLLGPKGHDRLDAAILAVEEVNQAGGVLGKPVELLIRDDETNPQESRKVLQKLIKSDHIQVVLGGMSSDAVMESGPLLAEKTVVMVSSSATAPELTEQPWSDWFFRTTPNDAFQGRILAKVVMEQGFTRLATIVQANAYGSGLEQALMDELRKTGWEGKQVVAVYFNPAEKNFRSSLINIEDSAPDVVLAVSYVEDGIILFKQAFRLGMDNIAWLTCDGNYSESMLQDPDSAEFMAKAVIAGTRSASSWGPAFERFSESYISFTGKEPGVYSDTSYDAIHLIAQAIEKAGTYDGKSIKTALLEVGQKYEGASGIITFSSKGDRISGLYELWKVTEDPESPTGYKIVRIKLISIG